MIAQLFKDKKKAGTVELDELSGEVIYKGRTPKDRLEWIRKNFDGHVIVTMSIPKRLQPVRAETFCEFIHMSLNHARALDGEHWDYECLGLPPAEATTLEGRPADPADRY